MENSKKYNKTIIGLGDAASKVVSIFKKYGYQIKTLTAQNKTKTNYKIKNYSSPEMYEKNIPKLKTFFKDCRNQVLFVVCGGSKESAYTLGILEQLKNKSISVLYIKPDVSFYGEAKKKHEWVCYNVLQEYARSGVFEDIILVHNKTIERDIIDITISNLWDKINLGIVVTYCMIDAFKQTQPELSYLSDPPVASRILTLGAVDVESGQEKLLFPLDRIKVKEYYYGISTKDIDNVELFLEIRKRMESEVILKPHAIYKTNYDNNVGYVVCRSAKIQGQV